MADFPNEPASFIEKAIAILIALGVLLGLFFVLGSFMTPCAPGEIRLAPNAGFACVKGHY